MTTADRLRRLADFIDNHAIPEGHIVAAEVSPLARRLGMAAVSLHITPDGMLPFILGGTARVDLIGSTTGNAHISATIDGIRVWAAFDLPGLALLSGTDPRRIAVGDVLDIVDELPDGVSWRLRGDL